MTRMGCDYYKVRGIKTIEHVHLQEDGRRWYGIFRFEVFKQLNKLTYALETDKDGWIG